MNTEKYDFDTLVERANTGASKWDTLGTRFGREDIIPMWVADMDFPSPSFVQDAIIERVKHGVFGYTIRRENYFQSIVSWMRTRHNWAIDKDWISPAYGVVPALTVIVQAFTEPGDGVLIQPPVYYPFKRVIKDWDRVPVENPLKEENGRYVIDFDDLENKAKQAKIMILCSPHNPVGRVWTKEELVRIGEICLKNDVLVISDEIHADLVFKPHVHTPFASISPEFAAHSVTCAAPSKTFNLAGLNTAYVITPNHKLKQAYERMSGKAAMSSINVLGVEAMAAAYEKGAAWLDQLLEYLAGNVAYLTEFIEKNIPEITVIQPEGTYLVWLDCKALNMDPKALDQFMVHEAGIALDEGHLFGEEGNGYQRINVACPRRVLEKAMSQLLEAINGIRQGTVKP